jgi:hypothetical protein
MESGGFLPPEPPGPEPDLGEKPTRQPPPPQPPPAPAQHPTPQEQLGWGAPSSQWQPRPHEPDNGPAVAGFVLAMVAVGLLVISGLLLAFVAVVCAIFAVVYSRRGKRRIESGETTKSRGLAQAGFVIGIIALVVSAIATLFEILIVVLYITDEGFREDFQDELEDSLDDEDLFDDNESFSLPQAMRLAAPVARGLLLAAA